MNEWREASISIVEVREARRDMVCSLRQEMLDGQSLALTIYSLLLLLQKAFVPMQELEGQPLELTFVLLEMKMESFLQKTKALFVLLLRLEFALVLLPST